MRVYEKQNTIGRRLGFHPNGKQFSRVLVEVGIKVPGGKPSPDAIQRQIAKSDARGAWVFDVDAVSARVMGGFATPEMRAKAEAIVAELMDIDREMTEHVVGRELAELGQRWEVAAAKVGKALVPIVNGILRREGAPFRFGQDGQVELLCARASEQEAI